MIDSKRNFESQVHPARHENLFTSKLHTYLNIKPVHFHPTPLQKNAHLQFKRPPIFTKLEYSDILHIVFYFVKVGNNFAPAMFWRERVHVSFRSYNRFNNNISTIVYSYIHLNIFFYINTVLHSLLFRYIQNSTHEILSELINLISIGEEGSNFTW